MPETLWSAALREMDPVWHPVTPDYIKRCQENNQATDVPRALVQGVVKYLSEDLGCDHSVGICMCSTIGVVQELKLALEGKLTCHGCGGDGFDWNKARHQVECQRIAKEQGFSSWKEVADMYGDSPGYITCPECNGAGYVRMAGVAA
jgi:hypothetical protein